MPKQQSSSRHSRRAAPYHHMPHTQINTYLPMPAAPWTHNHHHHPSASMSAQFVPLTTSQHQPQSSHNPPNQAGANGPWNPDDDEVLVRARAAGLGWGQIHEQHFPTKTANACRKRYERLMVKRKGSDWDEARVERLATAYRDMRESIWRPLAERLNEPRWEFVEKACMERGLKNLQNIAANRGAKKGSDSDGELISPTALLDDPHDDSGIGLSAPSTGSASVGTGIESRRTSGATTMPGWNQLLHQ